MPIPDTPVFRDFLGSISLTKPESENGYEKAPCITRDLGKEVYPIWYRPTGGLQWKSLTKRVRQAATEAGHQTSGGFVGPLLGLLSFLPGFRENPVSAMNTLINMVAPYELSQVLILPWENVSGIRQRIGPFRTGALDYDRFRRRFQRSLKVEFSDVEVSKSQGRFSIERDVFQIKAFDYMAASKLVKLSPPSESENISFLHVMNDYFHEVAHELFGSFNEEI